jgi:hypothetical protein
LDGSGSGKVPKRWKKGFRTGTRVHESGDLIVWVHIKVESADAVAQFRPRLYDYYQKKARWPVSRS